MKTIGFIGGMSWESSIEYYRISNELVAQRLGGLHSARSVMYSVDFAEIEALQVSGRWDAAADILTEVARRVEAAGADFIVLCTNTMHKVAEAIEAAVSIPLLHIADATATAIESHGIRSVGLLATGFTMEQEFYRERLERRGLTVITPDEADRAIVHTVIYEELCLGIIRDESRAEYQRIIKTLIDQGVEGIILGCTEIELLVSQNDSTVPVFPTTQIHAEAAVTAALA